MASGGQAGMRGYLIQTLITLLDALETDSKWISVTLEPKVESTKVDILWTLEGGRTKAVQVKSSQNSISKSDIDIWASELQLWREADEYELRLIGPPDRPATAEYRKSGKVAIPAPVPLDLKALKHQAAHLLDLYLRHHKLPSQDGVYREMLAGALLDKLATLSTEGCSVTRDELEKLISEWIQSSPHAGFPVLLASFLMVISICFSLYFVSSNTRDPSILMSRVAIATEKCLWEPMGSPATVVASFTGPDDQYWRSGGPPLGIPKYEWKHGSHQIYPTKVSSSDTRISDPVLDITLLNRGGSPIVVGRIGIRPIAAWWAPKGMPLAERIPLGEEYEIQMNGFSVGVDQWMTPKEPIYVPANGTFRFHVQLKDFKEQVRYNEAALQVVVDADHKCIASEEIYLGVY